MLPCSSCRCATPATWYRHGTNCPRSPQPPASAAFPLHLDGARLWEAQPYLGHDLAAIAALADTVYVSLYKGLGGLAGALLCGHDDVVAEARRWRTRHGGTLFSMAPYALAGLDGLDRQLPRMGEYYERARAIAAALTARDVTVFPDPPQCNAFRIFASGDVDAVNERIVATLEDEQFLVLYPMRPTDVPGMSMTEFVVDEPALDCEVDEAADAIVRVLRG